MKIPCKYERLEDCSREDLINKIMVRDKHCCDLKELLDKGLKKYKELEEENKKLKSDLAYERTMLDNVKAEYENLQEINKKLNERIRFLEQCLDNKEKVNKSLREEIGKLVMKQ